MIGRRTVYRGGMAAVMALLITGAAGAQMADDVRSLELLRVIHEPTAGVLKKGQYELELNSFGYGGMQVGIAIGLFDRFMFGVSFGGDGLIGYGKPTWNDLPGMIVKYRLIEESQVLPAVAIGFDMQGQGNWFKEDDRYLYKAPGGFIAASRNWMSPYGRFGLHGGVNINSTENDQEQGMDGFLGLDFSLNEQLALLLEYDFAVDDNEEDGRFGEGPYGYLNAGLRFTFAQALVIDVGAVDLFNSSAETDGWGREIRISYVETFTF